MSQLTRRQLLTLGGVGAGATLVGGTGLWRITAGGPGYTGGEDLAEPQVLTSRDGLLELELTAAPTRIQVGGREASVDTFNSSLPGPTLRVTPGDTIRVSMTNGLEVPTNLHVHGLHVSPEGNGDNPFVSIEPGESFDYEFSLPADHPQGTYWYHPHRHGYVADQIAAGLYGAIVVEDPEPLPVTRERVMVVSDLTLDASGSVAGVNRMEQMMGREGEVVLVNGQFRPQVTAAPGERERWRIVNACPSRYLRVALEGHQVRLLSRDLGPATPPSPEPRSSCSSSPSAGLVPWRPAAPWWSPPRTASAASSARTARSGPSWNRGRPTSRSRISRWQRTHACSALRLAHPTTLGPGRSHGCHRGDRR